MHIPGAWFPDPDEVHADGVLIMHSTFSIGTLQVSIANTFLTRLTGLLRHKRLPMDEGLLIAPCSNVHTLGMRFPIDVVFLDRMGRVLHIRENLAPWRAAGRKGSAVVLELAAGGARHHQINVGRELPELCQALRGLTAP